MIEINLLPKELREKKTIFLSKFITKKYIFSGLGYLVLFHIFLSLLAASSTRKLKSLEQNWQELTSQRKIITELKGELNEINKKIPLIEQLISNRVVWSEKLNKISDLLVAGVWLTSLSLEEKSLEPGKTVKSIIIRGSAASRMQEEPALIGRFMQKLKSDVAFSSDFSEIELGPIKKKKIAKTEVMDFILICRFKADKAKALLK